MTTSWTLDAWSKLSEAEQEAQARQLAQRELPEGFAFQRIHRHRQGEQERQVAEFSFGDATFALVPGCAATLGYDVDRPWEPTPEELRSWSGTAAAYDLDLNIKAWIAKVTMRPREVELRPFLVETESSEPGWIDLDPSDPAVLGRMPDGLSNRGVANVYAADGVWRFWKNEAGEPRAQRQIGTSHEAITTMLANEGGFRLPTPDEWEYICGAGAETLFRWGDHVPCDCYPTDVSPAEAAWRREWVLSAGTLAYPEGGFESGWGLHRLPSAAGVFIASDPYKMELTQDPSITRGGDGGSVICGGAGFFMGWLTLATAYFEDHACRRDPGDPISVGYTVARRVLPLG